MYHAPDVGLDAQDTTDVDDPVPNPDDIRSDTSDTADTSDTTDILPDVCDPNSQACGEPSCSDGVKNGDETDVDCGGSCPARCGPGAQCSTSQDCTAHATCDEANGRCRCEDGFQADNTGACIDIDECADGTHHCDAHATCHNTEGGFECVCDAPDYVGDGLTCYRAIDCTHGTAVCDPNAECADTGNGYPVCTCLPGYAGDGISCENIDECATNTHNCDPLAACTDVEGSFTCTCPTGYTDPRGNGTECADIDECAIGTHTCTTHEVCTNAAGGFTCECTGPGTIADGADCRLPTSCRDARDHGIMADGVYTLDPDGAGPGTPFDAYCDMTTRGGGWTLAIKADGRQSTFGYDKDIWKSTTLYQPASPNLDRTEAKLDTFNTVSFSEVMIGMEHPIGTAALNLKYMVLPMSADSLHDLFQGGFKATSKGRDAWKHLIDGSSLQSHCGREGFNAYHSTARVRIGILGNEQQNCDSPDSYIGIGGRRSLTIDLCGLEDISVGNTAGCSSDNGDVSLRAFGVVYVR